MWENVKEVLQDPQRVLEEFNRRGRDEGRDVNDIRIQEDQILASKRRAESTLQRLIDAYQAGALKLEELKRRSLEVRATIDSLESQLTALAATRQDAVELREIVTHLNAFTASLKKGLDDMPFGDRRTLVRLIIKRVEVDHDGVNVYYRVRPSG